MANTFKPKKGVTYYNITGPRPGVTAGPLRKTKRAQTSVKATPTPMKRK